MDSNSNATGQLAAGRFRQFVVPELPVLLRVARRLTGNPTDAEDLVQDALLRAYRAIDRFDGRHPRAWLLTILRNAWRNATRKARPRLLDSDEELARVPAHGADGRRGAEERIVDGVLDATLAAGLRQLPAAQRDVVLLVDVDGLTYRETADVLGVPTGTVMSRLYRARKRLRRHLESHGFTALGGGR